MTGWDNKSSQDCAIAAIAILEVRSIQATVAKARGPQLI